MTWIFYVKTQFLTKLWTFFRKNNLKRQRWDFKNGALQSEFMFVNIELYKSKKFVSHINLAKYCDIDACLIILNLLYIFFVMIMLVKSRIWNYMQWYGMVW